MLSLPANVRASPAAAHDLAGRRRVQVPWRARAGLEGFWTLNAEIRVEIGRVAYRHVICFATADRRCLKGS